MHDSTRRLICRLVFVGLCLVPTGSLCAWVVYRASPIYAWQARSTWQRTIYELTGMQATIHRVRNPTATKTLLENVVLIDPDSDQVVARIRVLEVTKTDLGYVAVASQPEIEVGQLRVLSRRLQSRLLEGPLPQFPTQILAGEVTLLHSRQPLTCTNLRCLTTPLDQSLQVTLEFHLAGLEDQSPTQLRVLRQRATAPPSTLWELHTGSTSLPCALISDCLPESQALGSTCHFQGTAWFEENSSGWDGEITGQFSEVDLERLIEPFPHKLTGHAVLTLSHTTIRDGRLVEAVGALQSSGGVISRSLLGSASQSLGITAASTDQVVGDTLLAYRQMAFNFQAGSTELQLTGECV